MKDQAEYQQLSEAYSKVLNEDLDDVPGYITPIDSDPSPPDHGDDPLREHAEEIKVFGQLISTVKHVHNHINTDSEAFVHAVGWNPVRLDDMDPRMRRALKTSVAYLWWSKEHPADQIPGPIDGGITI